MIYCRACGQCEYLGDHNFYEIRYTSGWERVTIDQDGDTIDYIDSEINDSEHANYECPHCCSEDIDNSWEGTNEDAIALRNAYIEETELRRRDLERIRRQKELEQSSKDPNREWDVMQNV